MTQQEQQPRPTLDITVLSRAELLSSPPIEDPSTVEDIFQEYFRALAPMENILGLEFAIYPQTPQVGIYMRDLIDGMTSEELASEDDANYLLSRRVEGLTGHEVHTVYYATGDSSFEEVIKVVRGKKPLTEEQRATLLSGETPEGMTDTEAFGRFFEVLLGMSDGPIEDPVYFKFD